MVEVLADAQAELPSFGEDIAGNEPWRWRKALPFIAGSRAGGRGWKPLGERLTDLIARESNPICVTACAVLLRTVCVARATLIPYAPISL